MLRKTDLEYQERHGIEAPPVAPGAPVPDDPPEEWDFDQEEAPEASCGLLECSCGEPPRINIAALQRCRFCGGVFSL